MKKLWQIACVVAVSCSEFPNNLPVTPVNPDFEFRPNILWIVAEDLGPFIPAFGDSTVVTPHLDQLAAEGICYDNFYTPHPVCAPARAAIITGMYANSIGASHMRTGPWYSDRVTDDAITRYQDRLPDSVKVYEAMPPPEVRMFTEYLRMAGYYCTNNAKEDYQFRKIMTAWDENSSEAHWRNRSPGKPFFSVFNIGVTHESRIWAKMDDSLWVDENMDVPVPPYLPDTEVGRRDIRRMYSNISEMDARVGEILKELKASDLLDSTIVFWYPDHGGPLPRQKRLLYESGVKVPMIIRFPNATGAGQRDGRMTSFVDLAPTVMSLADITPPAYMDGKAFLGPFSRKMEPDYVFGAADRFDEVTDRIRSVKDDRYKYIRYYMPEKPMFLDVAYRRQMPIMQELLRLRDQGDLTPEQSLWFRETKPEEELFDTWNDPHELTNLAEDPVFSEKLKELRKACENWVNSIDDTGLRSEMDLIREIWPEGYQPKTVSPDVVIKAGMVTMACETEGASIGYRFLSGDQRPDPVWRIYKEPFRLTNNDAFEVVAHRIGYLRSDTITHHPG